jgi:soluble cytochrome b562
MHVAAQQLCLAWPRRATPVRSLVLLLASLLFAGMSFPLVAALPGKANSSGENKNKPQPPTIRWSEAEPGCTFSQGDDGKYRYGLWSGDVGIVLAVDAREVQIIGHRIEPIFGVLLTLRYRGAGSLEAGPDGITLQFMKHFKVVQTALDPDDYVQKIQADADALDDETRRAVAKHPEKKQVREAQLQDYQKSVNELIEFLSRNSLRSAHLDRAHPEVSGWVFFNTDSKWLGRLKSQEEFVLRLSLDGKVFEFPFKLPPKEGELLLRKRE